MAYYEQWQYCVYWATELYRHLLQLGANGFSSVHLTGDKTLAPPARYALLTFPSPAMAGLQEFSASLPMIYTLSVHDCSGIFSVVL